MNNGYVYYDRISAQCDGVRALDFYSKRHAHSWREEWIERFRAGRFRRGEETVFAETVLRAGDLLEYHRPPWEEPPAPTDAPVVFEDDDVLVANKPAGLPVLPGGGFLQKTLVWLLRERSGDPRFPSPAHRLDRGTSGLIIFGKNDAALSALGRALRHRRIHRNYLAVVEGIVEGNFTMELPIGKIEHPRLGGIYVASPDGKPARTQFVVMDRDEESRTSLVEARLESGRAHQIRIHAAAAGHPLAGDPFYRRGGHWDLEAAAQPGRVPGVGDCGYRLHAWRVEFEHPRTGKIIQITQTPPEGFWCRGVPPVAGR